MADRKSHRGFAAMDPERQREIAARGGRASRGGGKRRKTTTTS
jgi:general stress protein YciG